MSKYAVGEKVSIPATVISLTSDESGDYYELKLKANNKIVNIRVEEEDIVANSTTSSETTPTEDPVEP